MSYLMNLTLRLTAAGAALPEELRSRHLDYITAAQSTAGGFAGRKGSDDLYYTDFALRALVLLGNLDQRVADSAAAFLQEHVDRPLSPIEFLSLINSAVLLRMTGGQDVFADRDLQSIVDTRLATLKRDGGGYAKSERSGQGSTYYTFLATLCKQMVGSPLEDPQSAIRLIRSRQRVDGGFVEIDAMRRSGTNPTAAAVGLLGALDALDEPTTQAATEYLAGMQTTEGGFAANTRIPMADLLSTFTGIVALGDLGSLEKLDRAAALRFAQSLEQPSGGFLAAVWDDATDVEYTFYGLGTLALLTRALLTEPED
jgi:geranylgeranyl transferase type-2 subunit beta